MNFLDACSELISLESGPSAGNHLVVEFLKKYCLSLGFKVEIQPNLRNMNLSNILIRPQSEVKDEVLLHSGLDTVDPGSHADWVKNSQNPFQLSIYGDDFFGLGVATKLDILCKIEACKKYVDQNLQRSFVIAGTYGNISGMEGAIQLVRRKKIDSKIALIGTPTENRVCNAGLGHVLFEVIFPFSKEEMDYQQQHDLMESSSTQSKVFYSESGKLSHTAITKVFDYLSQLPSGILLMDIEGGESELSIPESIFLEIDIVGALRETVVSKILKAYEILNSFKEKLENYSYAGFDIKTSQINLSKINKFKDHVMLNGYCKLLPSVPQEVYESWIEEVKLNCKELGIGFRVKEYKQAFAVDQESSFVQSCLAANENNNTQLGKTALYTEASVFARLGIECLAFGAGEGEGNIHQPEERVSKSGLEQSIQFYENFIKRECL